MEEDFKKPQPKMWDEEEDLCVKKKSLKNEKRLSKKLGFKLTPGSGNREWPSMKGDGATPQYMFECKETTKGRISLGRSDIEKLCREASTAGKEPVLILSVYGLSENLPKDWIVITAELWSNLSGQTSQGYRLPGRFFNEFSK